MNDKQHTSPFTLLKRRAKPSLLLYVLLGIVVGTGFHAGMQVSSSASLVAPSTDVSSHSTGSAAAANKPPPAPLVDQKLVVLQPKGGEKLLPFKSEDEAGADAALRGAETKGAKLSLRNVLGKHKSPFPDIQFPAPQPARPPTEECTTLVAIMTAYGTWDDWVLPMFQYVHQMPDAIDVVVVDDSDDETIAAKAAAFGFNVLRAPTRPLDQQDAINLAYFYFKRSPKYDTLVVIQSNSMLYNGLFDRLKTCYGELQNPAFLAPMINSMQVGEKSSDLDEKSLWTQNPHHRNNRDYYGGRIARDVHQRLPYTMHEHATWYDRAMRRARNSNMTSKADVPMLQSFALAFSRTTPHLPNDPDRVVQWDYNLFQGEFEGMVDKTLNGRPGDRETATLTYLKDPRAPMHTCLNALVYHDWRENGMQDHWGPNDWHVMARRNPKKYPPPKNAFWDRA